MMRRARRRGRSPARRKRRDAAPETGRKRNRGLRFGLYLAVLLCLATVLFGINVGFNRSRAVPSVVTVDDPEHLAPQLRSYLEERIQWVQNAPAEAYRRAELGLIYAANRRWPEARDSFRNASTLDPESTLSRYHLAIAHRELGDFDRALEILLEIGRRDPDFAPAQQRLGLALLEQGRYAEAETAFRRVASLAPDQPHGYIGMAEAAIRKHRFDKAVTLLEKALRMDRPGKKAHYLLGLAYRELGLGDKADRELKLGVNAQTRFMPDEWSARMPGYAKGVARQIRLAQRHLVAGRASEAVTILETLSAWNPKNIEVLNNLAVAKMRTGQVQEAREFLLRAVRINDEHPMTYVNLASCHLKLGRLDRALEYAEQAVSLAPNVAQAHVTKARILARMKRLAEAAESMAMAVSLDPQNAAFRVDLANLYLALGRFHDAVGQDLFMTHLGGQTNTLYVNHDGFFEDATERMGLAVPSLGFTSFGLGFADFDNDGFRDLYVANGRVRIREPLADPGNPYAEVNQVFRGLPDGRFEEVLPRGGTAHPIVATSRAAAFGDLDNDGAVDLVVANMDGKPHLLRNIAGAAGQWIMFRVLHRAGADALGAEVIIRQGRRTQRRHVQVAYSYCAGNDPRVHFGLGKEPRVDSVLVHWPNGDRERFGPFTGGRIYTLKEGEGQPEPSRNNRPTPSQGDAGRSED